MSGIQDHADARYHPNGDFCVVDEIGAASLHHGRPCLGWCEEHQKPCGYEEEAEKDDGVFGEC